MHRTHRPARLIARRGRVRVSTACLLGAALQAAFPLQLSPQTQVAVPDSLRAEILRLRVRLDSLEGVLARLLEAQQRAEAERARAEAETALARLRAAAAEAAGIDTLARAGAEGETAVGRQRSLQALNPEISATADLFARADPDRPFRDNFLPREFELSLVSALDPYSRAKVFLALHEPGGEIEPFETEGEAHAEAEVAVEEGYVEWVNLPGGLGLTLGRFYQRLGTLNRWHSHALGFQTRSLPHLALVGEEALAQTGISLYWLVPTSGPGTWQAWFEVTRSENENLFGDSHKPSFLAHLNSFWELSPSLDLDLGLSALAGRYEGETRYDQRLYNVEGALTWRPPSRSRYREAVLRAGLMVRDRGGGNSGERPSQAWGVWSMGEVRLARRWLAGVRWDWTENPADPSESAWLLSPTVTWWQSEFVRLRAEYDLLKRSMDPREGQLLLQVTFAMGPHKHERY